MVSEEKPEHRYARIRYSDKVDIVFMFSMRGGNWQLSSENWGKQEVTVRRSGETLRWSVKINGQTIAEDYSRLKDAAAAVSKRFYGDKQ